VLKKIRGRYASVTRLSIHPDGTQLATATGAVVTIWNAATLEELHTLEEPEHRGAVTSVAYSPDGTRLCTTSFDGQVRLFDTATHKRVESFGHHAEMTQYAAFSPDGYRLASVSGTLKMREEEGHYTAGELKVWNLRSPAAHEWIGVDERNVSPVTNYLNAVDFQPGTAIVATGGWRGKVRLVDVLRREDVQPQVNFGSVITSLHFRERPPAPLAGLGAAKRPRRAV
jgi:hypothetical protein